MRHIPLLLLTFLCGILVGCTSDPVKTDLEKYLNEQMPDVFQMEIQVTSLHQRAISNAANDYQLYQALFTEVVPMYRKFTEKVEGIRPETKEVRDVHEKYIEAVNTQYNALTTMLAAIEAQDFRMVTESNEKMDKGRRLIRQCVTDLQDLIKKHDAKFTNKMYLDR